LKKISDISKSERRSARKMHGKRPEALSDIELLAILLGSGDERQVTF